MRDRPEDNSITLDPAAPIIVTNEDEVRGCLQDLTTPGIREVSKAQYIIRIDARLWDHGDRMNAHWLKFHEHKRVTIERLEL